MTKRLSYQEVRRYIENNSSCVLLSEEYTSNRENLRLRCECGAEYETRFDNFRSQSGSRICPACRSEIQSRRQRSDELTIAAYVSENSDCTYLGGYINAHSRMTLRCTCGREFRTTFINFKLGKRRCNGCRPMPHNKMSEADIIEVISERSSSRYAGGWVSGATPFNLICVCGTEFTTTLSNFYAGKKQCNDCSDLQSKGERVIVAWLSAHGVKYEQEKRFSGCRYKRTLPFDFFLTNHNLCIEYDGEQHYRAHNAFGGTVGLDEVRQRDEIKTAFCSERGIILLRISYHDYRNIESILCSHVNTEVSK